MTTHQWLYQGQIYPQELYMCSGWTVELLQQHAIRVKPIIKQSEPFQTASSLLAKELELKDEELYEYKAQLNKAKDLLVVIIQCYDMSTNPSPTVASLGRAGLEAEVERARYL